MKNSFYLSIAISWLLLGSALQTHAQPGLIMNEVSNGASGTQEYYEMLLIGGPSDCNVDLRGWMFDDNNGDFSCGPASGCGIAPGHARFSISDPTWSAIPLGAIILVYNDAAPGPNIPTADPTDANGDMVYIVPISHPSIEVAGGVGSCTGTLSPIGCNACPGTGNAGYGGNTYNLGGIWNCLGLRNSSGDAAQTRDASGTYFHGVSYGGSSMTGGPDNLKIISTSGSGRNFMFSSGDHTDVTNFSAGSASTDETPGAPNNTANQTYINTLIGLCPLPVEFSKPLTAISTEDGVHLNWATSQELNFDHFVVERADELDREFREIGTVNGNGEDYEFLDAQPDGLTVWYRLKMVDLDGGYDHSRVAAIYHIREEGELAVDMYPNPASSQVNFLVSGAEESLLNIFDLQGRLVHSAKVGAEASVDVSNWPDGLYIWQVSEMGQVQRGKLQVR